MGDLLRKLILVGWLLLIDERFSLVRLLISSLISMLHLVLVALLNPFKHNGDYMLALIIGQGTTFIFMTAMLIKIHQVCASLYRGGGCKGGGFFTERKETAPEAFGGEGGPPVLYFE